MSGQPMPGLLIQKLSLLFCTQSRRTATGMRSIGIQPGTGEDGSRCQSQLLRDPSSTVRSAALNNAAAAFDGAQRASCAASMSGTTLTSAYIALPSRSAAMVLTQGTPSLASVARMSPTLWSRLKPSQMSMARTFSVFASFSA